MKKKLIFLFLLAFFQRNIAQVESKKVGINTNTPTTALDVNGTMKIRSVATLPTVPSQILTQDSNGVISQVDVSTATTPNTVVVNDATRFLGGSAYVIIFNSTDGTLSSDRVINNGTGTYSMGTANGFPAKAGGNNFLKGDGYRISNPSNGVFDIVFDVPFTQIYGVNTNILDSYDYNGDNPFDNKTGDRLVITDNTHIGFVSNSRIRVKTGDQYGNLDNRSFTFLVTGK